MKTTICAVLALLLASSAAARPKHWYKDPKWWAGEALIGAAIAADAHSTSRGVGMGLVESNTWALGARPSNTRIAGISLGYFAIQTALHASAWHVTHHVPLADSCSEWIDPPTGRKISRCTEFDQDRLGWRIVGYTAIPAVVLIINGHNAAKNYRLEGAVK